MLVLLALAGTGGYILYNNLGGSGSSTPIIVATNPTSVAENPAELFQTTLMTNTQLRAGPGQEYDQLVILDTNAALQIDSIQLG